MKTIVLLIMIHVCILLNAQTYASNIKVYNDEGLGFQVSYPDTWQSVKPPDKAVFTITNGSAGIAFHVANYTGDNEASFLNEYKNGYGKQMESDLRKRFPDAKIVESRDTILGNYPAHLGKIQYSIRNMELVSEITSLEIVCLHNKKLYLVILESLKPRFEENYKQFQWIIRTFNFKR